jgi:hypothetical protein
MISVRKSEDRRHLKIRIQGTWMNFDPENGIDPLRHGFRGLESLNEEHVAPEMSLPPLRSISVF